jgi:hypothetical protein
VKGKQVKNKPRSPQAKDTKEVKKTGFFSKIGSGIKKVVTKPF